MDDIAPLPPRPVALLEAYGPGLAADGPRIEALRSVLEGAAIELVGMIVIPGDESVLFIVRGDPDRAGPAVEASGLTPIRVVDVRWYGG